MTENVFENAGKSLQQAKDETNAILLGEIARHDSAIAVENEYHISRMKELETVLDLLSERMPTIPVVPKLPHSRACGVRPHEHGSYCSTNCPTCQGMNKTGGWE